MFWSLLMEPLHLNLTTHCFCAVVERPAMPNDPGRPILKPSLLTILHASLQRDGVCPSNLLLYPYIKFLSSSSHFPWLLLLSLSTSNILTVPRRLFTMMSFCEMNCIPTLTEHLQSSVYDHDYHRVSNLIVTFYHPSLFSHQPVQSTHVEDEQCTQQTTR